MNWPTWTFWALITFLNQNFKFRNPSTCPAEYKICAYAIFDLSLLEGQLFGDLTINYQGAA